MVLTTRSFLQNEHKYWFPRVYIVLDDSTMEGVYRIKDESILNENGIAKSGISLQFH